MSARAVEPELEPAATAGPGGPLLEIDDLRVEFRTDGGPVSAVRGVSLAVQPGRTLGIAGESGAGKSATALAAMGLLPRNASVAGSVRLSGRELVGLPGPELQRVRGSEIAMVFQDPLSSLHPLHAVGRQVTEAVTAHRDLPRADARARAMEILDTVAIPDAERRMDAYPHELSGGMRQRVMIAMALVNEPRVLILDEPTTALDVTVQAQILELVSRLQRELSMAVVLITHDLGVLAETADEIAVMHAGEVVERASADELFSSPAHPYTRALLSSMPWLDDAPRRVVAAAAPHAAGSASAPPLLEVEGLVKHFPVRGGPLRSRTTGAVRAVDGISLAVGEGETLGIVGETGCGKSTAARLMVRLLDPTAGTIRFRGEDITRAAGARLKVLRREVQMIFQDPYSSLNPRRTAGAIIGDPLVVHGLQPDRSARRRAVQELMERVGLESGHHDRHPHEFSSGQRQRIGIARALAVQPKLLVADEPVSALDVSVQAQVLDLLAELKRDLGLTLVLIAHDLAVVRQMCDRVAVMYLGRVAETADADTLYSTPRHPYTGALLSAVPVPDPARTATRRRIVLSGDVPSAAAPPRGCRFHTRCFKAQPACASDEPLLSEKDGGALAACHFPLSDAEGAAVLPSASSASSSSSSPSSS